MGTDLSLFEEPERHLTFRRFFRTLGTPNYRALNEDVGRYALSVNAEGLRYDLFRTTLVPSADEPLDLGMISPMG